MILLRPYQQRMVEHSRHAFAHGARRVLLTAPTGAGKTVMFCHIAHAARARGRRVCVLVHREELLRQVSDTLTQFGLHHAVIGRGRPLTHAAVQVASVFTLSRRLAHAPQFDLLIVDEAHHAVAGSWARVLDHYPAAHVLGVTATPIRLDGRGLAPTFKTLVKGPSAAELMRDGWLATARVLAPPSQIDTTGVRTKMGDFDRTAIDDRARTITGDVVDHYRRYANGLQAVAFCVSIHHATGVADRFLESGISADVIDGTLSPPDRDAMIRRFRARQVQILASCELISEGFDCPGIEAALMLRPTQSLSVYLQQVGRALRPSPGKAHAVILDHAGNTLRHGLPNQVRDWTLDHDRPKKPKPPALRTCFECYAIAAASARICPVCGSLLATTRDPREALPRQKAGELVEVSSRLRRTESGELAAINETYKQQLARARSLNDLQAMARERGYSPGWARRVWSIRQGRRA